MNRFKLALRLLKRDGRSGELTLLVLALLIAVASATTISLFVDRLQRTLTIQAAEFLAGDLVVTSSTPIEDTWSQRAEGLNLTQSQTAEFSSVLLENEQMLLAAIKAVSQGYPLRGFLKTQEAEGATEIQITHGPQQGTVWVEKRILSALNLQLGDMLTVGEKPLQLTRILTYEPDKRGDFYSFSPRVIINQADLPATGVIQPGSHVHYFYQFIGGETPLGVFKKWLKPQLNPSQRILDIHEDRPELGSALQRAERYLGLSSIVVILIAGVAIAMAAGRYTERHFNASALLRCLGCKQREILWLYTAQFLVLGALASAAGCLLGWLGQLGLFYLLKPLLPQQLANPSLLAVVFGFITGMAILLGFALPPLLRLQKVSPLRVLQRDLEPLPAKAWLIYGLAISIMSMLIWRYSNDWQMTAGIIGVGILTLLVLGLLVTGMLKLLRPLLPKLGLPWRFGVQGLLRNSRASVSQILAFSITLAAMSLSFTVRNDLIDQWQRQLPEHAPNHFVLNIIPAQQPAFEQDLLRAGIDSSAFYPVVRGRLVEINAEAVQKRVSKDSQGEAAIHRELSLTWAPSLPEDNVITAGEAWSVDQAGWVSVEQKLADNLGIKVGDNLLFTVGSAQVKARVANLRSLQWDTMKPNFYMIFSPGTLNDFPFTYLTSFYLPDAQKNLLNQLLKTFPAITVLEVDQILKQFKTILMQLTQAIDLLLYFALAAGFTVLFAAVYATLDDRIQQGALLRTLGAGRGWLRKTHLVEFGFMGALAGALAAIIFQVILYVLYSRVMHIPYVLSWRSAAILLTIGLFTIGLTGYWGVRQVVNQSPLRVLRRL
ncbi:MAG: ABC transporter permease [Methylomonas sp.]|jgi:putative ABC transport system permease protein|uniref:ABC transporter permease n=1 Tax=Methylomonas sp. TaxID=418 RepID=UPI0025CC02CB|nr:FtsX-like permease family protein [Methylomonas sp.]MCK9608234.1 ABC transporter permease [Methylomonas sp.]